MSERDDDSAFRVEIGLRAGMIAKAALGMLGKGPRMAQLHLADVIKQVADCDKWLKKAGPQ